VTGGCAIVTSIGLSNCKNTTDAGLEKVAAGWPNSTFVNGIVVNYY
jgi:hypothetical protein